MEKENLLERNLLEFFLIHNYFEFIQKILFLNFLEVGLLREYVNQRPHYECGITYIYSYKM